MRKKVIFQLMGAAEVASYLHIHPARLRQLRLAPSLDFPEPIQELACGPIWIKDQIVEFDERWTRKSMGRPKKVS